MKFLYRISILKSIDTGTTYLISEQNIELPQQEEQLKVPPFISRDLSFGPRSLGIRSLKKKTKKKHVNNEPKEKTLFVGPPPRIFREHTTLLCFAHSFRTGLTGFKYGLRPPPPEA
jgi:hypothetical protein